MLEMMEELNPQRNRPPQPVLVTGESRPQDPEAEQHHQRVAVVQRLRLDQPRIEIAEHAARFGDRPPKPINLVRLQQMLRQCARTTTVNTLRASSCPEPLRRSSSEVVGTA